MTDAPERIWIQSDHIPDEVALNKWTTKPDADETHLFTEYARADLFTCDAGFAAGIEAAALLCNPGPTSRGGLWAQRLAKLQAKIRALAEQEGE